MCHGAIDVDSVKQFDQNYLQISVLVWQEQLTYNCAGSFFLSFCENLLLFYVVKIQLNV